MSNHLQIPFDGVVFVLCVGGLIVLLGANEWSDVSTG